MLAKNYNPEKFKARLREDISADKDRHSVTTAFIDIVETNSVTGTQTTVGSYEAYSVIKTSDYHYIFKNAKANQAKTDVASTTTTTQ